MVDKIKIWKDASSNTQKRYAHNLFAKKTFAKKDIIKNVYKK